MPNKSAGLLMYRGKPPRIELFLVHPGGPFFARRDRGAWSIPKGEIEDGARAVDVALREFAEETGQSVASCARGNDLIALGTIKQRGGKVVEAWAFEGDWPHGAELTSNTFPLEWPRGSGRQIEVPEIDRAEFFDVETAREKINPAQFELIERLLRTLG